jgi:hypothetical protein
MKQHRKQKTLRGQGSNRAPLASTKQPLTLHYIKICVFHLHSTFLYLVLPLANCGCTWPSPIRSRPSHGWPQPPSSLLRHGPGRPQPHTPRSPPPSQLRHDLGTWSVAPTPRHTTATLKIKGKKSKKNVAQMGSNPAHHGRSKGTCIIYLLSCGNLYYLNLLIIAHL